MQIDSLAFLIALGFGGLCLFLWKEAKRFPKPALPFSAWDDLKRFNKGLKARLAHLPHYLSYASLVLFLLAFSDPHFFSLRQQTHPTPPDQITEGIAIYFILDRSGSMTDSVNVTQPDGRIEKIPKIELLRKLTVGFIEGDPAIDLAGRPNDLIGLVGFARGAQVLSPLTLDHSSLIPILSKLNIMQDINQEGTAIGYAIFKTANLIAATRYYAQEMAKASVKPPYEIKSAVMILVTDGFQDPNPVDKGNRLRFMSIPAAAEYVKSQNIHLYIVNVDPEFAESNDYEPHRHQMKQAAELTGGELYLVTESQSLADIYGQIDKLEKSPISSDTQLPPDQLPQMYAKTSFYPYLISVGILMLLAALLLKTTVLRSFP